MSDTAQKLEYLVQLCERIAQRNGDRFEYRVEISPVGHGLFYRFNCFQTYAYRSKSFVCGSGGNLHDAIRSACENIPSACGEWNYNLPL